MYLHFSNLNRQTTDAHIHALLSNNPSISYCTICHVKDTFTRQISTFALVGFNNETEMEYVINSLKGSILGGRKIIIQKGG